MASALDLTLREAARAIRERKLSPVDLTQMALARIKADEPKLNAYVYLTEDRALEAAKKAEQEIMSGDVRGELHGVPIAIKDLYDIAGLQTTAGSRVRYDHVANVNSACVERLEQAGAIIVGKTHTHEFAFGIVTPTTSNPWNTAHMPGGSSGGSGATVAARGCFMAMGTDTGGSTRIPAAVCGIVGLKPTYGRISRMGITPMSWSLDHAGTLTRTVGDAAVTLAALAGFDSRDTGSANVPVGDYLSDLEAGVKGLKIGVPRNYFFNHIDTDVERNVRGAIDQLRAEGAEIVEIDIPMADSIMPVESGLNLPEAAAYHRKMLRERRDLYGEELRTLLEIGEMIPATDYIAAQRVRGQLQAAWRHMFEGLDAIVGPTVPAAATTRGQLAVKWPEDGTEESVTNVFVRLSAPANVTGLPSIAVPCGFTASRLPTSFQVIGRPFQEARILSIARAYERATNWSTHAPTV